MQTKQAALRYAVLAGVLLGIEILIGAFVPHTMWLRSYGGDVLVIPLIYCLVRIFVKYLPRTLPLLMCGVGFLAELMQYFHLSDRLGFARDSLPAIILGTSFSPIDLACYAAGMLLIYGVMLWRKETYRNE